jgi:hypothetical protein
MRYQPFLFCLVLFLSVNIVSAQYYNTGQDPSSLKWMQIKTGHFTVIYPEKYGSGGLAFARSLDQAYSKITTIFPEKKFRIPVIIHNFTTQSNGYVAWAPRRMEIYPTPEQNTIPLDANRQLTTHEITHVLQMESLNKGFSRAMSCVLGEQFTGIVASLLPLWLLEGDAVFAESYLTQSGRGRTPSFQKQLKALAVEKANLFKYDKIVNDSYRDFVPSYYETGYQMTTWAIARHNPLIWNKVYDFTAQEPFTINPVNISLRKNTGLTKKKLYIETLDTLKQIWTKEINQNKSVIYDAVNPLKQGKYISYYSPLVTGTDSIIAIRTSLSDPPYFVLISPSTKTEKRIFVPGQIYPWLISFGRGKLVWVESQPDPRWENRNYSVIKILDLKSRHARKLSHKSRYMAAAISPDGKRIAASENTVDDRNNLIIIDSETGNILQSVPVPGNAYLQHPQWGNGGQKISFIFLKEAGEGIMSYSLINKEWENLVEAGRSDLQSSYLRNDSLFFISSVSGTDNILLKTPDNKISRLTSSRFGTSDLSLSDGKVVFSDYTSGGNNICMLSSADINNSLPVIYGTPSPILDRVDLKQQPTEDNISKSYTPEPYRKWQHLFRFHSWMPFYADIETITSDPASIRPGISVMSQNSLSTLTSTIGYEYSATKRNVFHSKVTWEGWFPVIQSQLDYGDDPGVYKLGETVGVPAELHPSLRFSNTILFPFQFSSGKFSQYLQFSASSEYSNNYIYVQEEGIYDYGQTKIRGRLYFSNYQVSAYRDIFPRWAQTIDLNYSWAPFDKNIYGNAGSLQSSFYFPGILANNGIRFRFAKEKQNPSKYLYGSMIPFPRGYSNIISTDLNFFSADYALPLVYPDFNIASFLYIKRIRADLFYDYASGAGNYYFDVVVNGESTNVFKQGSERFSSFGVELMADFHVFRIPYMVSGGLQTAWKNLNERPYFGFLFNMDLFGMSIGRRGL